MCFNVPQQELATINFQLSGTHVAFVDEFKYLGITISNNMSYRGTKTVHPPTLSQTTKCVTTALTQATCAGAPRKR